MGNTIRETTFGGIFYAAPFLWVLFFQPYLRTQLKSYGLFHLVMGLTALAFLIMTIDTQVAGILQRYYSDFGFALCIAGILILLVLYRSLESPKLPQSCNFRRFFGHLLVFCLFASLVYDFMLVFASGSYSIQEGNPLLYYQIKHLIQFWI
jgi:hypothetical protein